MKSVTYKYRIQDSKTAPLVVDTNVLQYMIKPKISEQIEQKTRIIRDSFDVFFNISFFMVISEASFFEIANNFQEPEIKQMTESIEASIKVCKTTLLLASKVNKYYKKNGRTASIGDLIIAATSLLTGSAIITANEKDFPSFLFDEVDSFSVVAKSKKNRTKKINLYILKRIPQISESLTQQQL